MLVLAVWHWDFIPVLDTFSLECSFLLVSDWWESNSTVQHRHYSLFQQILAFRIINQISLTTASKMGATMVKYLQCSGFSRRLGNLLKVPVPGSEISLTATSKLLICLMPLVIIAFVSYWVIIKLMSLSSSICVKSFCLHLNASFMISICVAINIHWISFTQI